MRNFPELAVSANKLGWAFYHIDGPGQLAHLDMLLATGAVDGIQWIPGAGNAPWAEWPDVRRRIALPGKKAQTFGSLDDLATIMAQAGTSKGMHHRASLDGIGDDEGAARRALARFGA